MVPARRRIAAIIALFCCLPWSCLAQDAVKGPVKILVGFPAGGSADIASRLIADKIRVDLGQPVIVENRPGAGGRIAAEVLKNATPDGTTLMAAPIVVPVLAPLVYPKLPYDPAKDFAPVSQIATYQFGFAVPANHPAKTFPEFLAWVKANPSQANFGSPAPGSLPHFFGVMIGKGAGIEMQHIGYKGGAPLATDLISGQIPAGIDTISEYIEAHRSGRLRILATSGAERSPLLPNVPTFKELGYPAIEGSGWFAIYTPAATPKAIIAQLNRAIVKALQAPDLREKFINLGFEPTGTSPEELARIGIADAARWAPVIRASGFTPE